MTETILEFFDKEIPLELLSKINGDKIIIS